MNKLLLTSVLLSGVLLSGCSVNTTTYPSGATYSSYTVGYDYSSYPAYNYGPRHTGYRYYDSDFYVGDNVYYGPRYHRNIWRPW